MIKSKLKHHSWNRRRYIDDLITIERYVLGERFGLATGYIIQGLKESYPHEFEIIYKELKPKQFKEKQKREKGEAEKERKEEEEYEKQALKQELELKQKWAEAGGKL